MIVDIVGFELVPLGNPRSLGYHLSGTMPLTCRRTSAVTSNRIACTRRHPRRLDGRSGRLAHDREQPAVACAVQLTIGVARGRHAGATRREVCCATTQADVN